MKGPGIPVRLPFDRGRCRCRPSTWHRIPLRAPGYPLPAERDFRGRYGPHQQRKAPSYERQLQMTSRCSGESHRQLDCGAQLPTSCCALSCGSPRHVRRHCVRRKCRFWCARRVGSITACVQFVTVVVSILVSIDPHPDARIGRHTGEGRLTPPPRGDLQQPLQSNRRLADTIAVEQRVRPEKPAALYTVPDPLDDQSHSGSGETTLARETNRSTLARAVIMFDRVTPSLVGRRSVPDCCRWQAGTLRRLCAARLHPGNEAPASAGIRTACWRHRRD
jgi:hypothetical protein